MHTLFNVFKHTLSISQLQYLPQYELENILNQTNRVVKKLPDKF